MPPSTFAPGHHLVGRYRIQALLGVGQTAEVYVAQDLSLQRTVVVKVLLPRLAEHEEVRRAFRDRIVRAATLSHPHLARVFDGGQESGAIFMITEYLNGGTLDDVLATGRTLSVDDGARLGRDVANALAYVHANGVVHGSLSPSKLLFDDEGRVRVSDVALAGLGDAYRERFTLDDVRYLSPEQAIGDPPDGQSDVYALALIIFEAVTGTTAFDGLTPEAVLRARINSSLPVRPELGTLDMLLAQAAVPDARLRLDAEQFSSRLSSVVSDTAPLIVAPVRGEVPLLHSFTPSTPRTSIGFRPPSPDQITGATSAVMAAGSRASGPAHARQANDAVLTGSRTARNPRRTAPRGLEQIEYDRPTPRRRLAFFAAALLLVLVAIGGGVAWKLGLFNETNTVPSLVGVNFTVLRNPSNPLTSQLKTDGFTVSANRHASSVAIKKNDIISQSPVAGTSAKSGQVITVTLSDGPSLVRVPTNLVGEDCASASTQLAQRQLVGQCPSSAAVPSAVTPTGRIVRVLYKGKPVPATVPVHSTLILSLSTGSPATTTTTTTPTPTSPTTTTTVSGTTSTTSSTTTTTTTAQPLITMPNVVGLNRAQVKSAMTNAGLYYFTQGPGSGPNPTWTTVVSQIPAAGTKVKKFSTVNLHVK
jgi:serine/threonine protein kinase